ncbi:hypothetical protein QBC43DRAFT_357341 [Cladorrhinum sp. PSN259]|nr:hypothetical protein QBC43DRAFT_357341 [Cladorrhinum sp. PSN259]
MDFKMYDSEGVHEELDWECPVFYCDCAFATQEECEEHGIKKSTSTACCAIASLPVTRASRVAHRDDQLSFDAGQTDLAAGQAELGPTASPKFHPVNCPLCDQKFPMCSTMVMHIETNNCPEAASMEDIGHLTTENICPNDFCDRVFPTLGSLIAHLETEECGAMEFEEVQSRVLDVYGG